MSNEVYSKFKIIQNKSFNYLSQRYWSSWNLAPLIEILLILTLRQTSYLLISIIHMLLPVTIIVLLIFITMLLSLFLLLLLKKKCRGTDVLLAVSSASKSCYIWSHYDKSFSRYHKKAILMTIEGTNTEKTCRKNIFHILFRRNIMDV